jgi:DNA-binding winged helix-turn-helix (wHTH) protein
LESIAALHQKATAPQTRMLTLRYLDQALNMVCNGLGLRLVFLFDEFDELCRKLTPRGFAALRALRDEYKYSLMYIVATRLALKRLREQVVEMEPFEELVSPQTIWLGPYARQDAEFMLQRLAARHNVSLDEAVIEQILQITGRHSGLLRESYNMARKHSSDLFQALVESAQVVDECQRIWFSLSPEEQQVMVHLVGDTPPLVTDPATAGLLQQKGLLNDKNQIFSPLFAAYIQQQHPQVGARIHLDPSRQKIFVDGREIRNLPPLEYKLMAYLVSKRGHVCSRDELLEHLYPEDALDGGGSDSRLAAVVKRLRKHVEPNRKDPKYIITVHGRGFRLVDGE